MEVIGKRKLLELVSTIGEEKVNYKLRKVIILAFLAGVFISLSAISYIIINSGMASLNKTYAKFISGICFSFGIFAVVVAGADLFTGNILILIPFLSKKIKSNQILKNWTLVYLFNFVGTIFIALIAYFSKIFSPKMFEFLYKILDAKVSENFLTLFFRGIGCNIVVCLAVWMSYACSDGISKFFSCCISVVLFLICGFEHSIANMFYITVSFFTSYTTILEVFYILFPVTIGNIVGGSIVSICYYFAYKD